jgi:hypothetical protein
MKDYRRILEVSTDATPEQIKAQYKRLVRIYHPDRFTSDEDKQYVETKLKEVTEAYHELLKASTLITEFPVAYTLEPAPGTATILPQPVAAPATLHFGTLLPGAQRTLIFYVENNGGPANNLQINYSDPNSWFKVTKGRRLHNYSPFPMEFSVLADTSKLEAGKSYKGWIEIRMDNAMTRVALSTQVARQRSLVMTPRRALIVAMVCLLLLLGALRLLEQPLPALLSGMPMDALQATTAEGEEGNPAAVAVISTTVLPAAEIRAITAISTPQQSTITTPQHR